MDSSNPVAALLRPEILAALTSLPFVLQMLRAGASRFIPAEWFKAHSGAATGLINALAVVGLVVSTGVSLHLDWPTILLQTVLAWVYTELMFTKVVEPASKSSNPVMPAAKGEGSVAPIEVTIVPKPTNGGK